MTGSLRCCPQHLLHKTKAGAELARAMKARSSLQTEPSHSEGELAAAATKRAVRSTAKKPRQRTTVKKAELPEPESQLLH